MSKVRSTRAGRAAVSVAALSIAAAVGGVAATQPFVIDLTALIVVGSSTHPDGGRNETFFGGKFNQAPYNAGGLPGPDLVGVDFGGGTTAIDDALQAHSGADNAVLASGWGAANASVLLMRLNRKNDPVLPKTVFVLDNNVSRPDGGFGTRYPLFALIGVNPFPSPTETAAKAIVDIAYQYNYNSNAPADLLNLVAHVNSLVAYLYGYRNQHKIDLPVDTDGRSAVSCGSANTCAMLASGAKALPCDDARCETPEDDRVIAYVTTRGKTTYVTYTVDELPLARLIRDYVPFVGNALADLTEPLLKLIVDSAYYGGNPIPSDPSRYRPARLVPALGELLSAAVKVPGAIHDGFKALSDNTSTALNVADVAEKTAQGARSESRVETANGDDPEAEEINGQIVEPDPNPEEEKQNSGDDGGEREDNVQDGESETESPDLTGDDGATPAAESGDTDDAGSKGDEDAAA